MVTGLKDGTLPPPDEVLRPPARVCRPMVESDIRSIVPWFANPDQEVRDHMDFPFAELGNDKKRWSDFLREYYFAEGATSCVATAERRIIGSGRIIPGRLISYLPPDKDESIYLGGVIVQKDNRHRGTGKSMAAHLLERGFDDPDINVAYAWVIDADDRTDPIPAYIMLDGLGFSLARNVDPHWSTWGQYQWGDFDPSNDPETVLFRATRESFAEALINPQHRVLL